ncbi:MAG: hypothetical protein AB7G06_05400 [Bdellovibrionales bacterium]
MTDKVQNKALIAVIAALLLALPLGACGKKPGFVDPPAKSDEDNATDDKPGTFPRDYPRPWL